MNTANAMNNSALEPKVTIRNLYKIFGSSPSSMVERVKNGISKKDLLDKHGHVLALTDVNLDVPARRIQVIMGLSGSGKSTLIRHVNRLIEPTEIAQTVHFCAENPVINGAMLHANLGHVES